MINACTTSILPGTLTSHGSLSANMYSGYDNDEDYYEDQQHNSSCSTSYDDVLGWNWLLLDQRSHSWGPRLSGWLNVWRRGNHTIIKSVYDCIHKLQSRLSEHVNNASMRWKMLKIGGVHKLLGPCLLSFSHLKFYSMYIIITILY